MTETTTTTIDQLHLLAVSRAVPSSTATALSRSMPQGTTVQVDATVRIVGTISKGNDHEALVPAAADPWALVAALLSRVNAATRAAVVREAVERIAAGGDDAEGAAVKAEVEAAMQQVKGATRRTVSGRITARLAILDLSGTVTRPLGMATLDPQDREVRS